MTTRLAALAQGARWYLAELTGRAAYERYRAHALREHPGREPLSRGAWFRARQDAAQARPQQRCC